MRARARFGRGIHGGYTEERLGFINPQDIYQQYSPLQTPIHNRSVAIWDTAIELMNAFDIAIMVRLGTAKQSRGG